jgi:hypothetical protein
MLRKPVAWRLLGTLAAVAAAAAAGDGGRSIQGWQQVLL